MHADPASARPRARILALSLVMLTACGGGEAGPEGPGEAAQEAGVRTVTQWHDPESKTAMESRGQTRYGKEIGDWEYFYPSGEIRTKGSFTDGVKSGKWVHTYPDGTVQLEEIFVDGKLDGMVVEYHTDGSVKTRMPYVQGIKSGDSEAFHLNGEVATKTRFENGHPVGAMIFYHDNGVKKSEVDMQEGKKVGLEVQYHPDGSKGAETIYIEGSREGKTSGWYANGTLQLEGQFEANVPVGEWKQYHPNGQLSLEGAWDKGRQVGVWKSYYEDGKPKTTFGYSFSESYDKPGAQIHGLSQEWHPDGSRKSFGFLNLGKKVGPFFVYDEAGAPDLKFSGIYADDLRVRDLTPEEVEQAVLAQADPTPMDPATPIPDFGGEAAAAGQDQK